MTYQEFQHAVVTGLSEHFFGSASISIRPIQKNNNVTLDGLTILEEGMNISPTIYLNAYYEAYQNGQTLPALITDILTLYDKNRPIHSIDVRFYTDINNIHSRILFKLIHYKKNEALLNEIPHFRYLDLAIVFYCLISATPAGSATILIRNSHLAYWSITRDELFNYAMENTPRLLPHMIQSLADILNPLSDSSLQDNSTAVYVLTNHSKLYGAACILYPDILKEFSLKSGSNLYVLPSSIHEVLLIPSSGSIHPEELNRMVCEVNATQVADEEILSDHIYYYSLSNESLTMQQTLI